MTLAVCNANILVFAGIQCWPFICLHFQRKHKTVSIIYIITPHWHDRGGWSPTPCKTRIYLFYVVSIMGADALANQGARASAPLILTMLNRNNSVPGHTMDMLWEKFQWILPLCMKPISFQSKASVVSSVTAAIFIDFSLKKLNVFSQNIVKKPNEYLNFTEQIPRNWNVDQLSMLITS